MPDDDQHMPDAASVDARDSPAPPPPASPTGSSSKLRPSPPLDDGKQDPGDDDNDVVLLKTPPAAKSRSASAQAPPLSDPAPAAAAAPPTPPPPPPLDPPASTAAAAVPAPSAPTSTTVKPKSTKHRSPSPPPPPPPPPLLTVRLDIALGGPENYEVDVARLAAESGQRNPTPPPVKRDTSDSEGDDSDDPKAKGKAKTKRGRVAEYDLTDPFIDDSELAIDDRTHFAQTKQQGFYVSSGEVALLKDKSSPKKPRSKRPLPLSSAAANIQPLAPPSAAAPPSLARSPAAPPQEGTRESPIALLDDDDHKPPPSAATRGAAPPPSSKRKASPSPQQDKKRRKVAALSPFHPDLEASIAALKECIAAESFEVKGKFPPALKPKLQALALQAILLDEYNDNFFARMPQLFPYNKFTMTKLIKRLVYAEHHALLVEQQDELLKELKELAHKGLDQAKAEWERNVSNWEERKERWDADLKAAGQLKPGSAAASAEPSGHENEDNDDSPAPDGGGGGGDSGIIKDPSGARVYGQRKPPRKYRLTEQMKTIFWQLYCLSNDCSRLTNEKNTLENVPETVSEQGMRKILYQKIINAFPQGWMTSSNISRDISVIKKKHESEQSRFDEANGQ